MLIEEIIKFIIYMASIIFISKYILTKALRRLAENLNLNPKTIGYIAGYATSFPELLTISISSFNGLIGTSLYNIISSNIINFIQYITTVFLNKNQKYLKNKAIKIDLILVGITIILPIIMLMLNYEINISIVPIFVLLFIIFYYINNNVHKEYLNKQDEELNEEKIKEIEEERKSLSNNIKYVLLLILSGILLFIIGDLLGNNLNQLCDTFNIPQILVGILLGFSTSVPELITFFESQKHHKKEENNLLGIVEATNNLFTSNVLNLFLIQSIGIIIYIIFA